MWSWLFDLENMAMSKYLRVGLAGLTIFVCVAATATQPTIRIRGTIESVKGDSTAIRSYDGKTTDLMLNSGTKFAEVLPSRLSDIKPGDFIGVGATGPDKALNALEVVVFPESMRGTGEGHYPWSVPAAVASADAQGSLKAPAGAPPVQGTMTNGTVADTAPNSGAPPVQGTMTNGTVAADSSRPGGNELTVSYGNGEKVQIVVPPGAPVVRFVPAQQSVLAAGAKVFVVASKPGGSNELSAKFVAVGKDGLMPPM